MMTQYIPPVAHCVKHREANRQIPANPQLSTTVDQVQLTGELTDERPAYPGEAVLVVDSPAEQWEHRGSHLAGIWQSHDDRKPTGWRGVRPITGGQARFLIHQSAQAGWRIGWTWCDLG